MSQLRVIMGIVSFILQVVSILIAVIAPPIIYHFYLKVEDVSVELNYIREHVESLTQHPQDMNILEELNYIRERVESLTRHPRDMNILGELNYIRERVESLTQDMEDMHRSVKAMDEDARSMIEKVKKMTERLDGQSEN